MRFGKTETENFKPVQKSTSTLSSAKPINNKPWTLLGLGMKFVYVAPGSFQMGSNDSEADSDEKPEHRVNISKGYWMGKYEVTQSEYQSIMGNNPSHFKGSNNPVEKVSWNDAVKFCQKLSAHERSAGRLPSGYEYRLPTEAEWEFASRGGERVAGINTAAVTILTVWRGTVQTPVARRTKLGQNQAMNWAFMI